MSVEIEFDVQCGKCGKDLSASIDIYYPHKQALTVEPCDKCLEEAREEGRLERMED